MTTAHIPVARRRRGRSGGGALWFYPLALIIAALLVIWSLGGAAFRAPPTPQSGAAAEGGAIVFGPTALAQGVDADSSHKTFVRRPDRWTAAALRLAAVPGRGGPSPAETGVRLLLTPDTAAALAGRPVSVTLDIASLGVTHARELAVSLQTDGPIQWVSLPIPRDQDSMTFELPATEGQAPSAIGFWTLNEDGKYNFGVEIKRVLVRPAP